jgi:class 3 adenylate cyclase
VAVLDDAATHGILLRAGIHTGEVELVGDEIDGICVDIVERITSHSRPSEILVSRTVKDLVVGPGTPGTRVGQVRAGSAHFPTLRILPTWNCGGICC